MSHQTGCKGCSVRGGRRLQRTLQVRAGAHHGTSPLPPTSRFAKYYKLENGSEYRTLLKAFGIRFDVLVYGNVSPWRAAGWVDRGGHPDQPWAQRRLPGRSRVLPLIGSETLSSSHLQCLHLYPEGARPAAPRSPWLGVQVRPLASPLPCWTLCPPALVLMLAGWQVQHHPHYHQLRGSLHLRGSGEFSLQAPPGGRSGWGPCWQGWEGNWTR